MSRKIVITSGKGGVGKTTIVASLGYTLAKNGYKTLLVDMDFGLNNLDVLLGIENKIVYDIIDVIEGRCQPRQALIQDFTEEKLFVLPSTHSFCRIRFGAQELMKIIRSVENYFDFVLIDCPAGMDGGFRRAVECADESIVITTPHLSAVRDADKIIAILAMKSKPYLVVNRARGDLIVDEKMLGIDMIADSLNATILGVIPEDDNVSIQMLKGGRFNEDSAMQKSLDMIARYLTLGEKKIYDCTKKYKGLVGSIRKNLKRRL